MILALRTVADKPTIRANATIAKIPNTVCPARGKRLQEKTKKTLPRALRYTLKEPQYG